MTPTLVNAFTETGVVGDATGFLTVADSTLYTVGSTIFITQSAKPSITCVIVDTGVPTAGTTIRARILRPPLVSDINASSYNTSSPNYGFNDFSTYTSCKIWVSKQLVYINNLTNETMSVPTI